MKTDIGKIDVSTEMKHNHTESLAVSVENHITLSAIMDNGLVNERFNQPKAFHSEKHNILKTDLIDKPVEGLHSNQDSCLSTMGETTAGRLKYTLNRENENAVLEVKMQPQDYRDEVLGKYQGLPAQIPSEDATCVYLPPLQLHSYNINLPLSLMLQHRNSVLSRGTSSADGAVSANVDMIPVRLCFYLPNVIISLYEIGLVIAQT